MKNIFYLIVFFFIFSSCEEVPVVIPEFSFIESGKVILVEELTGIRCPNCPAGSARLAAIKGLFPDNMVLIAIHGIELTKPLNESKYDFRNQDAKDLEVFLKIFLGKPSAYFNRIKFEELGNTWGNPVSGQWQGYIERELQKEQLITLSITKDYDPEARQLTVTVAALPLETLFGEFKINLMLTESDIEDAQEDQQVIIEDYIHNHVLRKAITKFDGDFFTDKLIKNELQKKTYSFTLPVDEQGLWIPENIEIVAFISSTEGVSEEVLQAAEVKLID